MINGSRRYLTIASTIRQILMASSKTSRKYAKTFRSIYRITHKRSPNYCLSSSASSTDTNVFLALVYHWCEHVSSIFFGSNDYRSNFRGFFFNYMCSAHQGQSQLIEISRIFWWKLIVGINIFFYSILLVLLVLILLEN